VLIEIILGALLGLLAFVLWQYLIRYTVPRFYLVCGPSMSPSLVDGQVVVGFKVHPNEPLTNGAIYGYIAPRNKNMWVIKRLAYQEKNGCYFLGDNSQESTDSRDYGLVRRDQIMFEVYWYKGMPRKGRKTGHG